MTGWELRAQTVTEYSIDNTKKMKISNYKTQVNKSHVAQRTGRKCVRIRGKDKAIRDERKRCTKEYFEFVVFA